MAAKTSRAVTGPNIAQAVALWRERIVHHATRLDRGHNKGGHDWFSLWVGFVIGLGRPDLATYSKYLRYGYPEESEAR